MESWAIGIDEYIQEEIQAKNLTDKIETYEHIIKEISKAMGLHPDVTGTVKMEKIYRWIHEVLKPQQEIEKRRKLILG